MLKIRSGIGDILIAKMICKENNIQESIEYDKDLVKQYREDNKPYYYFLDQLIHVLFSKENIKNNIKNNPDLYRLIPTIKDHSLSEYFDLRPIYNFDYIVFQTKGRFLRSFTLSENIKNILEEKYSKLTSKYKIILLGEKNNQKNYENIYDILQNLNTNNEIIDMTTNKRLHVDSEWNLFIRDVSILHYSKLNINIGLGGNFVMSTAFSENTISYTYNDIHPYMNTLKSNTCFSDINRYFEFMESIIR